MSNLLNRILFAIDKYRLRHSKFIILSNNCWGFEIYKTLGREYNTPFVGLFICPDSYLMLLENFESFLKAELKFKKNTEEFDYPVGLLGENVEIHFLHYSSEHEALKKWNRRVARLIRDIDDGVSIYAKLCDREGCTNDHVKRFFKLPFKNKISISVQPMEFKNHIYVPSLIDKEVCSVIDGVRLFRKRYRYFDFAHWLLKGNCRKTTISRILSLIS